MKYFDKKNGEEVIRTKGVYVKNNGEELQSYDIRAEPETAEEIRQFNIWKYIKRIKEEKAREMAYEHTEEEEEVDNLMEEIINWSPKWDDDLDFDMWYVESLATCLRDIFIYNEHVWALWYKLIKREEYEKIINNQRN